ncbi:MAG TPA: lysophospholipid acyltransferase family protein [Nitriliruptorales bacterium]
MSDHLHPVFRATARRAISTWLGPEVHGAVHIPGEGPAIVAANHRSHADSLAIGVAAQRPVRFLGTRELEDWPVVGRWLPALGMVPIERGAADAAALDRIAQLLEAGQVVVIYPEGGRSRDGRVHRPRGGIARLAAQTGARVVPCGVTGTEVAWPVDGRPRIRRHRVSVAFGAPLQAPRDDPRSRREFVETLHDHLVHLSGAAAATHHLPTPVTPARKAS